MAGPGSNPGSPRDGSDHPGCSVISPNTEARCTPSSSASPIARPVGPGEARDGHRFRPGQRAWGLALLIALALACFVLPAAPEDDQEDSTGAKGPES